MRLFSNTLVDGERIPEAHALGVPGDNGPVPGANRSPHLRWEGAPAGTRSFALICVDPEVPSSGEDVNRGDRTVPYDLPRVDFYHWVLTDIPAGVTELAEAADADGLVPRGKPAGPSAAGVRGINDYTGWFAGDPDMAGDWYGYDGPFPPPNDLRLHRYFFRLFALDVERLPLDARFTAADVLHAMHGHVLGQATIYATYSLNPAVKG